MEKKSKHLPHGEGKLTFNDFMAMIRFATDI